MAEDVSKVTIMILLILTIVVSLLSTMIIIDRADQIKVRGSSSIPDNAGQVSLKIERPVEPDFSSGQVSLQIKKGD